MFVFTHITAVQFLMLILEAGPMRESDNHVAMVSSLCGIFLLKHVKQAVKCVLSYFGGCIPGVIQSAATSVISTKHQNPPRLAVVRVKNV